MRTAISNVLTALLIISGCKKDDFQYSFGAPSKLLVSVNVNGQLAEGFNYDGKINPRPASGSPFRNLSQADIVQGNNPIYAYYYNVSVSTLPPQYGFSYDYDGTGLPAKGYRVKVSEAGDPDISEYEYIDNYEEIISGWKFRRRAQGSGCRLCPLKLQGGRGA